eukprot:jgi/Galph1/2534/GphlegSOOS_G1222.1
MQQDKKNCESSKATRKTVKVCDVVPPLFQFMFPFDSFNAVQSACLDAFCSEKNLVISAPTDSFAPFLEKGSGKTTIFELAICRLLFKAFPDKVNSSSSHRVPKIFKSLPVKIVYLSPTKSLCAEKVSQWTEKFSPLGLSVSQVDGDSSVNALGATPEKWDAITRKCFEQNHRNYNPNAVLSFVSLLLVDEVHNLAEARGGTLEAVVTRMKLAQKNSIALQSHDPIKNLRIIAVSATVPNLADIGEWIGADDKEKGVKKFDASYRPVQLKTVVLGFKEQNPWTFDKQLSEKLPQVVANYSHQKPVLIFCPSRKSTMNTANFLAESLAISWLVDEKMTETFQDSQLKNLLKNDFMKNLRVGIAFHNADVSFPDRSLIEQFYKEGIIKIICTTTTLAQGVNLPAHLVIIKDTRTYHSFGFQDYDTNTLFQMLGRAGRPQFDTDGVVVIMTRSYEVHKYKKICEGSHTVIESTLSSNLMEHLNAEICRRTICNMADALLWLKSTFLWIRMKKNPLHYRLAFSSSATKLEQQLKELCMADLRCLQEHQMIAWDEEGFELFPREAGKVMAKYYVDFETMRTICNEKSLHHCKDILLLLSKSDEFKTIGLRKTDKKILSNINEKVKYPIESTNDKKGFQPKSISDKVYLLIQAVLEGDNSLFENNFSIKADANRIMQSVCRIIKAIEEYLFYEWEKLQPDTLRAVTLIQRALNHGVWHDNQQGILRQIPGIGPTLSKCLSSKGICSLDHLQTMNPRALEQILGRNPPFGNEIIERVKNIPLIHASIIPHTYSKQDEELILQCSVGFETASQNKPKQSKRDNFGTVTLLISTCSNELLAARKIFLEENAIRNEFFRKTMKPDDSLNFILEVFPEKWIGRDVQVTLLVDQKKLEELANNLMLPKKQNERESNRHKRSAPFQNEDVGSNHSCG